MKTSLLIMAAGIGSRFGGGIKQLEAVGPSGEIIIDYSIHDAIEAGFNKIVFVIRRAIEQDFMEVIGRRIEKVCAERGVEVAYAFQEMTDIPEGFSVPAERKKPWGTGQAVLAAKNVIHEPFAVINADDYYGKDAFFRLHDFLSQERAGTDYCMAGFVLKNTLSEFGGVTRGVCQVSPEGFLESIAETRNIVKRCENGRVFAEADGAVLDLDSYVSMNMWGLQPAFFELLEKGFRSFLEKDVPANPEKAEYLVPIYIGQLLAERKVTVKVLDTSDSWFGVTYKEDKPYVVARIRELIQKGVYAEKLY